MIPCSVLRHHILVASFHKTVVTSVRVPYPNGRGGANVGLEAWPFLWKW